MYATRINFNYDLVKECQGCCFPDETEISATILSFQLADCLLRRYSGTWGLTSEELRITLSGVNRPLRFELNKGLLSYGVLRHQFVTSYTTAKGLNSLADELIEVLDLPVPKSTAFADPILSLFVKLIEIFYARCGLKIIPYREKGERKGWEISLSEKGLRGWLSPEGIAENRFGEKVDIKEWHSLRPEKIAAYVFGFYKFCNNYKSPLD